MKRDLQKYITEAREHFDKLLDEKIDALVERTQIERERFVKINPMDFVKTISGMVEANGNIADYIQQHKTPETFLISPLDAVEETANQICYKTHQDCVKIRAHKCSVIPIPAAVAQAFFVKNHRQSAVVISSASVNYALVYEGEIVSVMTYDLTAGAVRGKSKSGKYELLRLAIKAGTQVNGGASKLQKACEDAILELGYSDIFSYSNATINEGGVYQNLGFERGKIDPGRAYVVMPDYSLIDLATFSSKYGSGGNATMRRYALVKVHIGGNRIWTKHLIKQQTL